MTASTASAPHAFFTDFGVKAAALHYRREVADQAHGEDADLVQRAHDGQPWSLFRPSRKLDRQGRVAPRSGATGR